MLLAQDLYTYIQYELLSQSKGCKLSKSVPSFLYSFAEHPPSLEGVESSNECVLDASCSISLYGLHPLELFVALHAPVAVSVAFLPQDIAIKMWT